MMKMFNTPKGYDSVGHTEPWYRKHYFPILPMFERRDGNEWNCKSFSFSWLFFRVWSLEHFALEASIELESTGLNVKFILPYLRVVVRVIPLPWDFFLKLQRKPKGKSHAR